MGQHVLNGMATCEDSRMKDRNAPQHYVIHKISISVLGNVLLPRTYPNLLCSGKLRGWKRFSKYVTRSAAFADLIVSDNEYDNDNSNDGDDDTQLLNKYRI